MTSFNFPMNIKTYGAPLALCRGYFWECDDTFSWEKKDRKNFKGEISCVQTSCPTVNINVYMYENNKPTKSYSEYSGWGDPEVTLGYINSDGIWWFADYINDELVTIRKDDPDIDDEWEDLQVDDSGMIIHYLNEAVPKIFL